jgi:pimeloyl-ACP methyl ester carboxylesterase
MPYAENRGVRIYYEVEGEGSPLVLVHGFTDGLEGWREYGYAAELKKEHRLVLIDARGHGRSDKPHDPEAAAGLERRPADVVAVLDDLGIDRAHYFGYSLGGWIGFGLAKYAPRTHPLVDHRRGAAVRPEHGTLPPGAGGRDRRLGSRRGEDARFAAHSRDEGSVTWQRRTSPLDQRDRR